MNKWEAALLSFSIVAAASVASTAALAARAQEPTIPVPRAMDAVKSRADFGKLWAVHYDLKDHCYDVLYEAKDGSPEVAVVSALTGRMVDQATADTPHAGICGTLSPDLGRG